MALGVPDSLKIGPQPGTAMISKIPKPSNYFLSILAMLANLASLSTNLYDNHMGSEVKITAEAQVVTIKTLTDFANLLGFIFFNILGMRNAKILDSLNVKLPPAENIEEIDQLGRQRNELSGVGPVAAGVGISSVPSAGSQVFAGASGAAASSSVGVKALLVSVNAPAVP